MDQLGMETANKAGGISAAGDPRCVQVDGVKACFIPAHEWGSIEWLVEFRLWLHKVHGSHAMTGGEGDGTSINTVQRISCTQIHGNIQVMWGERVTRGGGGDVALPPLSILCHGILANYSWWAHS